jgi:hypothetical protein
VKSTRQPGEKKNLKNNTASACCMGIKQNKKLIYFIYQQIQEIPTAVK